MEKKRIPPFVALGWSGGTALRYDPPYIRRLGSFGLEEERASGNYYRDAGAWSVNYKWKDGVLMTKTRMRHLNNIPLVEITKEEWEKDNEGHV